MGDRGNVYVCDENEGVYLYSHWGGYRLPETVQKALARQQRWSDAPYLARIIFCEMVRGEENEETGFGIWSQLCDNEYAITVVDTNTQSVGFAPEPKYGDKPEVEEWIPMTKYIELSVDELRELRDKVE